MSEDEIRAPMIDLGPSAEQVEKAARNLLDPAESAWVKTMTLKKKADGTIEIDGERGLQDLTPDEERQIVQASEIKIAAAIEEGQVDDMKYLRPATNPWIPGRDPD